MTSQGAGERHAAGAGQDGGRGPGGGRLRADAARNRAQLLAAAREAFRESGTAAPLEDIARRAGVNIATLYRRFPTRADLIRQVVHDGFTLVLATVDTARRLATGDPLAGVEHYLTELIGHRDLLVLPLVGGPVADDAESLELQQRIAAGLEEVLDAGRAAGCVRGDVTAVDLITASALACRPLPHLAPHEAMVLATRHVRVFLDGLRPAAARPLTGRPPPYGDMAGRLPAPVERERRP